MKADDRFKVIPIPPYTRKLLHQITEAIRQEHVDLFDPCFNKAYSFNIQITVAEARALVDLGDLAHGRLRKELCRDGFMKYSVDGQLIEDRDEEAAQ